MSQKIKREYFFEGCLHKVFKTDAQVNCAFIKNFFFINAQLQNDIR